MKINNFKNKKIALIGFGKENLSVLNYLRKFYPKQNIIISDKKDKQDFSPDVQKVFNKDENLELNFGKDYLKNLNVDIIVLSPGINCRLPEIKNILQKGIKLTTAVNIFFANKDKNKIIGITGSKGKSTVSSLVYHVLKTANIDVNLVGNIGNPSLESLCKNKKGVFVYELSSYMLETLKYVPDVSVFTSFFPDHLDYHKNVTNYFKAKTNICPILNKKTKLVYNYKNRKIKNYALLVQGKIYPYNDNVTSFIKDDKIFYKNKLVLSQNEINLLGTHNLENILAVFTLSKILKIKEDVFKKALKTFKPLEHRLELVGMFKDIIFYNDANATTPQASICAINVFSGKLGSIILGGSDRGYDFNLLAKKIFKEQPNLVILLPTTGKLIWQAIKNVYKQNGKKKLPKKYFTDNMKDSVEKMYKHTPKNKIALLSTGSPSYSVFKNFEEKGNLFKKYIKEFSDK